MEIRVRSTSRHPLPSYQSEEAAGMDLHALLDEPVTLKPLERSLIPTGLYVEIPAGYELQIRARSGLALRHGISLANGVGTVDSDYRGEIGVILVNLSNEAYTVQDGDRVAQMVLSSVEKAEIKHVNRLENTLRSD